MNAERDAAKQFVEAVRAADLPSLFDAFSQLVFDRDRLRDALRVRPEGRADHRQDSLRQPKPQTTLVTSAKVSRPRLLLGIRLPLSKYWTLATSTESSLHFWKPACWFVWGRVESGYFFLFPLLLQARGSGCLRALTVSQEEHPEFRFQRAGAPYLPAASMKARVGALVGLFAEFLGGYRVPATRGLLDRFLASSATFPLASRPT